jgi:hypothetical protein
MGGGFLLPHVIARGYNDQKLGCSQCKIWHFGWQSGVSAAQPKTLSGQINTK